MPKTANGESLTWVHVGDLHITDEKQPNYRDFLSIIDTISTHLAGDVVFCILPGDNADDGSAEQYMLIRRGLERLKIPLHVIPGDHDRKPGCLFLDVLS
jgi:Icc protein